MSNEKPILFNTEMVKAILEGRKTQTRRPIKCGFLPGAPGRFDAYKTENGVYGFENDDEVFRSPFGKPGDVLWVRESARVVRLSGPYQEIGPDGKIWDEYHTIDIIYDADDMPNTVDWPDRMKWKPISGHKIPNGCHKEACRLKLKVKRVWVERVQDISEDDAIAEGIEIHTDVFDQSSYSSKDYMNPDSCYRNDAVKSFLSLYESIYGVESIERNDWLFCGEFEVIK